MNIDFQLLIKEATRIVGDFKTIGCVTFGGVGAAILSSSGNVFSGVCVDAACGIGFCAEHAAIAEMLKNKQYEILACVAVETSGKPVPPCGRCREFMYQLSPKNLNAKIMISITEVVSLRDLLPHAWAYD